MEVLYPSFLPKVPHNPTVDEDDEVWLRQREEEQHERREAMCKLENYPKPVGVKDVNEQSDTVELGYVSLSHSRSSHTFTTTHHYHSHSH